MFTKEERVYSVKYYEIENVSYNYAIDLFAKEALRNIINKFTETGPVIDE